VILPYCNIGRGARLKRVILDPACASPKVWSWAKIPNSTPALPPHRNGVCLITKPMIDRLTSLWRS
jgi:glucose-1-phosphate adenylyltransferase